MRRDIRECLECWGERLCNLKLRVKLEGCECADHAAGIEDREAHLQRWALVRPRDGDRTPVFLFCWVRGTETVSPPAQGRNAEVTTMVNQSFRPRARPPSCAVGCGERERYLPPNVGGIAGVTLLVVTE